MSSTSFSPVSTRPNLTVAPVHLVWWNTRKWFKSRGKSGIAPRRVIVPVLLTRWSSYSLRTLETRMSPTACFFSLTPNAIPTAMTAPGDKALIAFSTVCCMPPEPPEPISETA